LTGEEVLQIFREKDHVDVLLHLEAAPGPPAAALRQLAVRARGFEGNHDGLVPLARVASFTTEYVPDTVSRLNGRRQVTVLAEIEGNLPAVVGDLRERFRDLELPPGVTYEFSGQYPILIKAVTDLLATFGLALLLIYAVLVVQFRSLVLPLGALAVIPVALAGSILLLGVCGEGLDVSVGMGLLALFGVAVNNAIILIEYRNRRLAAGDDPLEALRAAVGVRLRPVAMTSLTTVAALVPAAIGSGAGSKVFQPFALTLIGGLVVGTAATLAGIPAILSVNSRPHDRDF
jgi:multidrug efflux pump subunit AcrB